ncbi:hypothetical protein V8F20_008798 [Naviculisporaceae sp. PSN 640]
MRLAFLAALSATQLALAAPTAQPSSVQESAAVTAEPSLVQESSVVQESATPTAETSAIKESATPTTWYSTGFVNDEYGTLKIIQYDTTAVTPVPTSELVEVIEKTTITQETASRDISTTVLITETRTEDVTTETVYIPLTTPLPPPSVLVNETTTTYFWVSPTIATVTITTTVPAEACSETATPVTSYQGTYSPLPDQTTTEKTRFPTAVITQIYNTVTYALYPYTGYTVTHTDTEVELTYLSTETTTVTQSTLGGRYTSTVYESTVTATRSEFQLAYSTATVTASSCAPTATYAAKCAPNNLLSEQDGLGVAVRILPNEWSFPVGIADTLIGLPGGPSELVTDASACCKLCVDNAGCAASEWAIETETTGSCRLYWFNNPSEGEGNPDDHGSDGAIPYSATTATGKRDTCGRRIDGGGLEAGAARRAADNDDVVGLQYYANSFALPGQASLIQSGCGRLEYVGELDPWF